MLTVPWVLQSEIYPSRFRGLGGGITVVSNWCANNLIVRVIYALLNQSSTSAARAASSLATPAQHQVSQHQVSDSELTAGNQLATSYLN
ncbi:hypothetical protein RIF29_40815 [Crotalaria pallida]|uniref:Uncharacterized protein n=1 Tax=Crotalaria pallida TaxID=3830 RepID=A0AAN9E4J5_CROPI